jgi:hypothetical protein
MINGKIFFDHRNYALDHRNYAPDHSFSKLTTEITLLIEN